MVYAHTNRNENTDADYLSIWFDLMDLIELKIFKGNFNGTVFQLFTAFILGQHHSHRSYQLCTGQIDCFTGLRFNDLLQYSSWQFSGISSTEN